jgi:thioredoxin reductase
MLEHESVSVDVAVIGGGPAGISACLELSRRAREVKISLFESEENLGGVPRSCHLLFGMRDLKRILTGPGYARKLSGLLRRTPVDVHTQATALSILPAQNGKDGRHLVTVASPEGLKIYQSRFVVLATGCCESSLGQRLIPSARPAGILTTWQLQQMVYLHRMKPGNRALVIGSEDAALSTVLTLRRAGISIAGVVEEDEALQTYPLIAQALSGVYRFPIHRGTSVKAISGVDRVEGAELIGPGGSPFRIECDTVVLSGKFRPLSQLIDGTPILRDQSTAGPLVDMNLMTSVQNVFSAGNVLRGGDMHDLCALEGRRAARSILARMNSADEQNRWVSIRALPPVRYVVPQKVAPAGAGPANLSPGFSIQIARTLRNVTIEAWSGESKIWERACSKVIGNHRIPIPVERFDWKRVDPDKGIELRLKAS